LIVVLGVGCWVVVVVVVVAVVRGAVWVGGVSMGFGWGYVK
jgi:hypothetical protein